MMNPVHSHSICRLRVVPCAARLPHRTPGYGKTVQMIPQWQIYIDGCSALPQLSEAETVCLVHRTEHDHGVGVDLIDY